MQNIELLGGRQDMDGLEVDSRCSRDMIGRQRIHEDYEPEYFDEIEFEKTLQPSQAIEINENLSCLLRLGVCGEVSLMATIRDEQCNHVDMMDQEEQEQPVGKGFSRRIQMLTDPDKPDAECPMFLRPDEESIEEVQIAEAAQQTHNTPTKSNKSISTELCATFCEETRKDKLKRYMEKRSRRNWNRKVYYDCRKKVADSRLRIKGRFITRDKAEVLLGQSIQGYSLEQLKFKLEKHMEVTRKASAQIGTAEPKRPERKKMASMYVQTLDDGKMQEQEPTESKKQERS